MTFRKVDLIYLGGAILVVVGVSLLPSPKDRNPPVPRTPKHYDLRLETDCLTCHAPGAINALRTPPHPKRQDCLHCHRTTS